MYCARGAQKFAGKEEEEEENNMKRPNGVTAAMTLFSYMHSSLTLGALPSSIR